MNNNNNKLSAAQDLALRTNYIFDSGTGLTSKMFHRCVAYAVKGRKLSAILQNILTKKFTKNEENSVLDALLKNTCVSFFNIDQPSKVSS